MKPFSIWRFILAALVLTIIAQIIYGLDGMFFSLDYYKDPALASLWSKYMMPAAGPPPASFMYMSLAFNFIGALIFTGVYAVLKHRLPGKSIAAKGFLFALAVFLLRNVAGALSMILLINIPLGLVLAWTAEELAVLLIGGPLMALINK